MSECRNKRIHVIACGVLAIDFEAVAERLGLEITTDYLPGGLHDHPGELRRRLQEAIDLASGGGKCDRIVVGYGLCGRGTVGIHARSVPLAIPKVHDCIALFLGSDAAYKREFHRYPGTYYISAGWFEEKVQPQSAQPEQEPRTSPCAGGELERLSAKYGRENAEAIVHFLSSWQRNYQRAAFVDTGAPRKAKYAAHARAMAEEFGWKYEALDGDLSLLEKSLIAEETTDEIVVVPPEYVTAYDPLAGGLKAAPAWEDSAARAAGDVVAVAEPSDEGDDRPRVHYGLGIDAGGTYTDAVLYDFRSDSVLAKSKAPTTRWDFTLGIRNALDALDADLLREAGIVAVSTTLATNAIVEGVGQKVGLLFMPPFDLYGDADIPHNPKALIAGRLVIDGTPVEAVEPLQVRRVAREMVHRHGVGAFAVSGYAGHVNPEHELLVREILREETALSVTCGHELSELLGFCTRARTAVLNARIIPHLERFLAEAVRALRERGIDAPVMVVKGDGSLMNTRTALERPVETILSGPAASVAGAKHLTGLQTAIVADVGGTTTDTAALRDGAVRVCPAGTRVGGMNTGVKALDMRTAGLGGDSLIAFEKRDLRIGPRRVAPIAWLAAGYDGVAETLDYLAARAGDFSTSTAGMEILAPTGSADGAGIKGEEAEILSALGERPRSVAELGERLGKVHWSFVGFKRLEENHLIQRCGLTPTDLLHAVGRFTHWDAPAATRACELFAGLMEIPVPDFIDRVLDEMVRRLAMELFKKQLDERIDTDGMDECPACQALTANAFRGGEEDYDLRIRMKRPIVGIGAPAHYFLPRTAKLLNAEVIIPHDADVANAIGAITSNVVVTRTVRVCPDALGRYSVDGLPGAPGFARLDEAMEYAVVEIARAVREAGRAAGTSETRVETRTSDRIASASDGTRIFLERIVTARLSGRPDAGGA